MSVEATGVSTVGLSWVFTDEEDDGIVINDVGDVTSEIELVAGTGNHEINLVWHRTDVMASGGSIQFDLHNLTVNIFNGSYTVSFNGGHAKAIIVRNRSETIGSSIVLSCTSSNEMKNLFNGSNGSVAINRLESHQFTNLDAGFVVDSTHRYITLTDSGYGAPYDISIVGTSGT